MNTPNATVTPPPHTRGRRTAVSSPGNGTTPFLLEQKSGEGTCAVNAVSDDRARLRAAADELLAAGIPNADKLLRLGATEMVRRCLAAWRVRGDGDIAVLAQMLLQGGPSERDAGYVSQRQRVIADMNAWQRGYPEHAHKFAS